MLIGYARVSKTDGSQSLDLQRDALRAAGIDDPANLYHDLASGVRDDRPGLDSCLRASGVGLRVLTGQGAQIDTTTTAGRLVFGILRGAGRVRAGADPGNAPAPEEVEQAVNVRIEEEIQGIDGIKQIQSTASEGMGTVMIELDPELRGKPVDAAQLPAGEPDPDRSIERLQVATGNRHGSLRLIGRKVGVPVGRDVGGIHTAGQDQRQRLSHSASMGVEDVTESIGSGRSPAIRTPSPKTVSFWTASSIVRSAEGAGSDGRPRGGVPTSRRRFS